MKLKKIAAALAALMMAACTGMTVLAEDAAPVETGCSAYVVMDADTGQVLLEKNADKVSYPASIIKVMTLGLACEKAQGNWSQTVVVQQDVLDNLEPEAAHIALRPGEVVKVEDMLYATCIQSACDAANVLAAYVGGDVAGGVAAMNAKAAELGLKNTHFTNPTGLHDEQLYSTAREMAMVTRWALQQPGFKTVYGENRLWTMHATNIQPKERYFRIDDFMRIQGYDTYRDYVVGSKSGWHDQALYTLTTYAEKDGMNLIGVTMGSPTRKGRFEDMAALLDYAFAHFHRGSIPLEETKSTVEVWGGGGSLGNVTVTNPVTVEVLLAEGMTSEGAQIERSVPEKYVLGAAFAPSLTVTLPGSSVQAASTFQVPMTVTGMEEITKVNTFARTSSTRGFPLWPVVVLVLAAAAVILWMMGRPRFEDLPLPTPAPTVPARRETSPRQRRSAQARAGGERPAATVPRPASRRNAAATRQRRPEAPAAKAGRTLSTPPESKTAVPAAVARRRAMAAARSSAKTEKH